MKASSGIAFWLVIFIALLILPAIALYKMGTLHVWGSAYILALSMLTAVFYFYDKSHAIAGKSRIPEVQLHLLELAGGWPGTFLAQHLLRHKSAKMSYQLVFRFILILWQAIAFDSMQRWKFARLIIHRSNWF